MRYAIVVEDIVQNIVEAEADYAQQKGWIACPGNAGIGWKSKGGNMFDPPDDSETITPSVQQQRNPLTKHILVNYAIGLAAMTYDIVRTLHGG